MAASISVILGTVSPNRAYARLYLTTDFPDDIHSIYEIFSGPFGRNQPLSWSGAIPTPDSCFLVGTVWGPDNTRYRASAWIATVEQASTGYPRDP